MDSRRKIVFGAGELAKIERGELDEKKLRAMLDSALTRKDDRALFGALRSRDEIREGLGTDSS